MRLNEPNQITTIIVYVFYFSGFPIQHAVGPVWYVFFHIIICFFFPIVWQGKSNWIYFIHFKRISICVIWMCNERESFTSQLIPGICAFRSENQFHHRRWIRVYYYITLWGHCWWKQSALWSMRPENAQ